MAERAFIVMQIGAKDSPERKRADEIYTYVISPAVVDASLEPYRADLDFSPGAITPKFLSELLEARLVIADLTGRNPNVFYELGITHSFARPLISIADSSSSLPFDAKDERVIELGDYASSGLTYAQGEEAKAALQESLRIVLADGYVPPSPLRELAANASVDRLAPENPIAAELAQMRETLEDMRTKVTPRVATRLPPGVRADIAALRKVVSRNIRFLDTRDFEMLSTSDTSTGQDNWSVDLRTRWRELRDSGDLYMNDNERPDNEESSDEPPF